MFKKLRPTRFFERFEKSYIYLIINHLSRWQNFHLFNLSKKSFQVLNLHFGLKYHFVKSRNGISAFFLAFLSGCIQILYKQGICNPSIIIIRISSVANFSVALFILLIREFVMKEPVEYLHNCNK